MKKNYALAYNAIVVLFVVLFSHCAKPPIIIPSPQFYEITQITGVNAGSETDTIRITYNSQHNPIQIAGQHISTGNPQWLMGYDGQRRLRVLIGAYYDGNPFFETAHKYLHDQKNRVATDSVFYFGSYDRPSLTVLNSHYTSIRKYTYDNKDRIIDIAERRFTGTDMMEIRSTHYFFNASGNAYKISTVVQNPNNTVFSSDEFPSYDDKVNPHQLHPVWQLMDLDYNKNNAFVADSYNKYGLPIHVTASNDKYSGMYFLQNYLHSFEIRYGHK